MSNTLWVGIVAVVCVLEAVRIGLTTYVLLQLLQDESLRVACEPKDQAIVSLRTSRARSRRESLFDPTLAALPEAMDAVASGAAGTRIDRAAAALDEYAAALIDERDLR